MKQLLLMRHAKSSWDNGNIEDIDRTLNERGLKDAAEMGRRLHKLKFIPDLIICSTAKRTTETALIVAKHIHYNEDLIDRESDLYHANMDDLVHLIRNLSDDINKVMIIGHNPTFTSAVGYLGDTLVENLPTSGMALIELNGISWKQTTNTSGKTLFIDFPKNQTAT